ncbi:2-hydroxychromene-2-carboxylate isomerase [Variovorax sp. HW608]|uniref:2-hydroxychromene-2-carboxylate isomerase n=1 Tax=Variovorax sp. HW608 TaxID=1034889 RepID=UPI00081F9869|nr:2-hydroxychromene-2-carboxylate isomerase [Variovorax sp. HW608]SCK41029.1 2-hydroxychromene-2-carboxylate isomerase [Variovorax sp. HW608]
MKHITFHLDFISPYAYLAFEHLPQALEGLTYNVAYRPLLFGALLKHHGQLGPAEIAPKRTWTYRHILWLGRERGIPVQMPATHPFNPLPYLRLALATSTDGDINRHVTETIFRDLWRSGGDPGDEARLAALAAQLRLLRDPAGDEVKAQLKQNTDEAIADGVFGVPTFEVDGRQFWGFDGLGMLRAYLAGDDWFDSAEWATADQRPALRRSNR